MQRSQLYSADTLRKLPIDLLTNGQIRKRIYVNGGKNLKEKEAFLILKVQSHNNNVKILK